MDEIHKDFLFTFEFGQDIFDISFLANQLVDAYVFQISYYFFVKHLAEQSFAKRI